MFRYAVTGSFTGTKKFAYANEFNFQQPHQQTIDHRSLDTPQNRTRLIVAVVDVSAVDGIR
jgi:hypothetical protein